jgi:hypothetical protein
MGDYNCAYKNLSDLAQPASGSMDRRAFSRADRELDRCAVGQLPAESLESRLDNANDLL